MFVLDAVDHGFMPWLSHTKDYVCLGCCRSWVQALVESHQKTKFVLDAVDHGFKPWLSQTKDYVCLGWCRSWVQALVESHQRLCLSWMLYIMGSSPG